MINSLMQSFLGFNGLNDAAFKFVNGIASMPLNQIMYYMAESFFVVLPLIAIYLFLKKDKNVYSFVFAMVVLYAVGTIIKDIIMEPRPCNVTELEWINHFYCEGGYSFPSNHATVLTGLAIFTKNKKVLTGFYIIWLVILLFGRVYLGQHYLTDVIAGIIISIAVSLVIYKYKDIVNKIGDALVKNIFGRIFKF